MSELQEPEVGQSEIDLRQLPSVLLQDRKALPNCSAVYFVTDADWSLLYIGSSKSLVLRWLNHNKYDQIIGFSSPRISWIETPEHELLKREGRYIHSMVPLLNSSKSLKTGQPAAG